MHPQNFDDDEKQRQAMYRPEIQGYFNLKEKNQRDYEHGKDHFQNETDFKLRLKVIAAFLLVECQQKLGRHDDAKMTANSLFDTAQLSFQSSVIDNSTFYGLIKTVSTIDKDEYDMCTSDRLEAYLQEFDGPNTDDPDGLVDYDEETVDEIRFEYSVARKVLDKIYCNDVTMGRLYSCPRTHCSRLLQCLLPSKQRIYESAKKAMYYSISGHAFALLGCVDESIIALERAENCQPNFPTFDANIDNLVNME